MLIRYFLHPSYSRERINSFRHGLNVYWIFGAPNFQYCHQNHFEIGDALKTGEYPKNYSPNRTGCTSSFLLACTNSQDFYYTLLFGPFLKFTEIEIVSFLPINQLLGNIASQKLGFVMKTSPPFASSFLGKLHLVCSFLQFPTLRVLPQPLPLSLFSIFKPYKPYRICFFLITIFTKASIKLGQ